MHAMQCAVRTARAAGAHANRPALTAASLLPLAPHQFVATNMVAIRKM